MAGIVRLGSHRPGYLGPREPGLQVAITLLRGAPITIRVNDAAQSLDANEGKTRGALLLLGVQHDNLVFEKASVSSRGPVGRVYQLLIPFDRPLTLLANSVFFKLSDANGHALPRVGNAIPLLVTSPPTEAAKANSPGQTIVLHVTGTGN